MVWLACDITGTEIICNRKLERLVTGWNSTAWFGNFIALPKGSIKHLIGRELTWEDEPVEFTEVVG